MAMGGGWVLEGDIEAFFDSVVHAKLREVLSQRVPIKEQHTALARKLRGHDAYYRITGNARALVVLRLRVRRIWQTWLNRRSWKAKVTWTRMNQLLGIFPLPPARVVHSIYRAANP
jgi:hypothetical protein